MQTLWVISLCLFFMTMGANAATAAGFACEPRFQPAQNKHLMPHTFFDQSMASIETLYPEHVVLLSRRTSIIAGVDYSLIVYKDRGDASAVRIDGAANLDSKAWVFNLTCPATKAMDELLTLLEQIANLKNLPTGHAD